MNHGHLYAHDQQCWTIKWWILKSHNVLPYFVSNGVFLVWFVLHVVECMYSKIMSTQQNSTYVIKDSLVLCKLICPLELHGQWHVP